MDLLFVSHDAGRTGAPMVLLHLQSWLNKFSDLKFGTLFRNSGVLVDSFSSVSEFIITPPLVISKPPSIASRIWRRIVGSRSTNIPSPSAWVDDFKKNQYKIIYSNTATNGEIVERLKKPGVRVITHIHELDYWLNAAGKSNWDLVKSQTDRFIACSNAVAESLINQHGISNKKIDVFHEFVSTDIQNITNEQITSVRNKLEIPSDAFLVVASGAELLRKGKDLLVPLAKACFELEGEGRPFYFMWVGNPGNEESRYWFRYDAAKLGLTERVKWVGEIANPHLYFSCADAFAMLSREDPFPLVCLESALHRKPIVCFADAGGIPELVEKDAGFIVPYLGLTAMAKRLLELRDNSELASSMGATAAEKVKALYSVNVIAPRIHEIIQHQLTLVKV
ncbi:MAG: glycosyltransferase family 4 protein [bacterium]